MNDDGHLCKKLREKFAYFNKILRFKYDFKYDLTAI